MISLFLLLFSSTSDFWHEENTSPMFTFRALHRLIPSYTSELLLNMYALVHQDQNSPPDSKQVLEGNYSLSIAPALRNCRKVIRVGWQFLEKLLDSILQADVLWPFSLFLILCFNCSSCYCCIIWSVSIWGTCANNCSTTPPPQLLLLLRRRRNFLLCSFHCWIRSAIVSWRLKTQIGAWTAWPLKFKWAMQLSVTVPASITTFLLLLTIFFSLFSGVNSWWTLGCIFPGDFFLYSTIWFNTHVRRNLSCVWRWKHT